MVYIVDPDQMSCSVTYDLGSTGLFVGAQFFKANDVIINDLLKFTSSDMQTCWNFLLEKFE